MTQLISVVASALLALRIGLLPGNIIGAYSSHVKVTILKSLRHDLITLVQIINTASPRMHELWFR